MSESLSVSGTWSTEEPESDNARERERPAEEISVKKSGSEEDDIEDQFKESDDGDGLTASALMLHEQETDENDWFDYDGVAESLVWDEEDEDDNDDGLENMIKSLYTSEIQLRKEKEKESEENLKPKKKKRRKKKIPDNLSVFAVGSHEQFHSHSRSKRREKLQALRIHRRRKQKKQDRMDSLRDRDMKECTFKPKQYTNYKLENRGDFLTELEDDLEKRKFSRDKKIKQEYQRQKEWFKPKTNPPMLLLSDTREVTERLYENTQKVKHEDDEEETTSSTQMKATSTRINELYLMGKNRNQRQKMREKQEEKRLLQLRKSKISSKSAELARHRQHMYVMRTLEQFCDTRSVNRKTQIPYRILIDIFIHIGFYRKSIVQGDKLMFSDSEVTLHDQILKHLDDENVGFVKLEDIIQFINELYEADTKLHQKFRALLDCQLHSPPPHPSRYYYLPQPKSDEMHMSPSKKIPLSRVLETVGRLQEQKEIIAKQLEVRKKEIEKKELQGCTFKPTVSHRAKAMAFDTSVIDRLMEDAEERQRAFDENTKKVISNEASQLSPLGSKSKRPLGYLNKEIFSPTTMPQGFGETVQRLQLKRVQAMQEEHDRMKRRALFDERYKNRLGSNKAGKEPLMHLEIVLGANRVKRLVFYEDDSPPRVARMFCQQHGIHEGEVVVRLTKMIEENLYRLSCDQHHT